jgi:hypothetical protein
MLDGSVFGDKDYFGIVAAAFALCQDLERREILRQARGREGSTLSPQTIHHD